MSEMNGNKEETMKLINEMNGNKEEIKKPRYEMNGNKGDIGKLNNEMDANNEEIECLIATYFGNGSDKYKDPLTFDNGKFLYTDKKRLRFFNISREKNEMN
eukprot:9322173-Heterocapsa_arctica.AAC.1